MKHLKSFLVRGSLVLIPLIFPVSINRASPIIEASIHTIELKPVTIVGGKIRKKSTSFLGFTLQKNLNTAVDNRLKEALIEFKTLNVPTVIISSLVRHKWNPKSKHRTGKAVDFEFNHELIDWLVSEEGQIWINKYGITFYIEDKPGSKALIPYLKNSKYSKYVFENKYATGKHIHINI